MSPGLGLAILLVTLLAGSWFFCGLMLLAVERYLVARPPKLNHYPPISILKPLSGLDEELDQNLRTFFEQDYPAFEILGAARRGDEAGLAVLQQVAAQHPAVPLKVMVTEEPPYPNAKVYSLSRMMPEAENDLLVMSDSDIRVDSRMLKTVAAEFQDASLGVATCPYRAVPGDSLWSTLEAIGMNTEFWGGCLTARLVEGGVRFAVGPTIVARRSVLTAIGGFDRLRQYLAEDFVMGQFAAEAGHGVILSSYVIEHRIGAQGWQTNFSHRLRWNRSSRRSRPAGYVGQLFTYPLPLGLAVWAAWPAGWPGWLLVVVLSVTVGLRALAAHAVAGRVLKDPLCRRLWWLIPVQDGLSFLFWLAGFWGNTIVWRGRKYRLEKDGTFELVAK